MIATSVTGMAAAQLRLDVAAHRVANVNTPDSGVQPAEEMPELVVAGAAYGANAAALRAQDATLASVLDILA